MQLAPLDRWLGFCFGERYVEVRTAQQETADTVFNTGMAVISDVGAKNDVHPKRKQPVGYRLALLAENKVYDYPALCEATTLTGATLEDGVLKLKFLNVGEGLRIDGDKDLDWLQILQNGVSLDVKQLSTNAAGNTLTLLGKDISAGADTEIRIAKTGWYQVNLYNSAGIPARPAVIQL